MKWIIKRAVTPIKEFTGSIIDSTNITDKTTNTYSANVIDQKIAESVPDIKVPTKTSELENDSEFITIDDIPESSGGRFASVGQSDGTTTNPYYLVAEMRTATAYADYQISFHVWSGYGDDTKNLGILTAHFRLSGSGVVEQYQLRWEYANTGINLSDFKLAFNAGTSPAHVQLWAVCDSAWQGYHFDVISEGVRTGKETDWTLYNTWSAGSQASITSGYTVLNSTLNTIYNPVHYGNFVVSSHGISVSYAAYNSGEKTATLSKSGYYPLGIVSPTCYNYTQAGFTITPRRLYNRANGSCTIAYWGKNDANGATSNCTAYVDVLWVKV